MRLVPAPRSVVSDVLRGADGVMRRRPDLGISVAAIVGDEVAYDGAGSRADDADLPVDQDTIFEIGSVTKTFTALMLALAITQGSVRPNDLLDSHLPRAFVLPEGLRGRVQVTDLASHQSGLANLSSDFHIQKLIDADPVQPFAAVTSDYLMAVLSRTERLDGHGAYQYNNFAFALLGEILAGIHGVDYATALHRLVLAPYGLSSTTLDEGPAANSAGTYGSGGAPVAAICAAGLAPAGGLRSNAADMAAYLRLQLDPPDPLAAKAVALTHQPHLVDGEHAVGLGWEQPVASRGTWWEKSGDTFGNSALVRFDRARRLGVVVLSDHQDAALVEAVAEQLWSGLGAP